MFFQAKVEFFLLKKIPELVDETPSIFNIVFLYQYILWISCNFRLLDEDLQDLAEVRKQNKRRSETMGTDGVQELNKMKGIFALDSPISRKIEFTV